MKPSKPHLKTTLLRAAILTTSMLPAAAGTLYWDTNGATAGSGNAAGAWDTGTNWTLDPAGAADPLVWTNGESVVFSAGTDGLATKAVTIAGTVSTPSILLKETGLINLTGGTLDITGGSTFNTSILGPTTARSLNWTSGITGTGPLTLAVNGDLSNTGNGSNSLFALTGANTFLGSLTITSGVVSTASVLGDPANKVILNGGGLVDPNLNTAFARNLEIGPDGGTIRNYGSVTNFRLQGTLSGTGGFRRTDGGTTVITGDGAGFTGAFNLLRGTTQIGDGTQTANPVPNASGIILGDATGGGTIRYQLDTSFTLATPVTFPNAASTFVWQGRDLADTLTIPSSLGPNGATGILRVNSGTLALTSGADVKTSIIQVSSTPTNSAAAEVGLLSIGSGASVLTRFLDIGQGSNNAGNVIQTGGTVTIESGGSGFRLGHWGNGQTPGSTYNLTGGTLDVSANNIALNVGWDGAGTLNVGGTGLAKAWRLYIDAAGVDQPGIVNLNPGGTIEVGAGGILNDGTTGSQLNLSGGTIKATASATWAGPVVATDATQSTIDIGTAAVVQSGVLSGGGNLTVAGSGILAVNNTGNTLTGTFTRTDGTVAGTGLIPGAPVINAAVAPGPVTGGPGTLSFGEFATTTTTLNGALRMDLDAFGDAGTSDHIAVSNNVSFGPNAVISPLFSGTPLAANHTILTYGGTRTGVPVVDPALLVRGMTFTVNTATPGEVRLAAAGTANPASLTWTGDGTGNVWNLNQAANWGSQTFYQYDSVRFDDGGNNTTPIAITGTLSPGNITVDSSKSYIFSGTGSLAGTSQLVKSGTGDLTLLNNSTFGLIDVSGGNIIVGNGGTTGSLGGTGAVTLPFGSTLEFNHSNAQTLSRPFNPGSGGTLLKKGPGSLTTAGGFLLLPTNITVDGGSLTVATGSFSGNRLEGDGLITVNPGATLVVPAGSAHALGGNNNVMTETFIVNGGTITLNQEQYFNKLILNGALMNGTSDARSASTANLWTVTGTTPSIIDCIFTNQNTTNVVVEDVTGSPAADLTVNGNMNGSGLVKTGAGTLRSTGAASAFTGALSINEGTFQAASARALGFGGPVGTATVNGTTVATGSTLDLQGVTVNEIVTLQDGATLTNTSPATTGTLSNGIAGVRVVDLGSGYTAAPTLVFAGGGGTGVTATAAVTTGGLSSISTTAAGTGYTSPPTVTITGTGTLASASASISQVILNGGTSWIGGEGNLAIAALMQGSGGFVKVGSGSLTIPSGSSSFTGNVTVESGTLTVSGASVGTNSGLGAKLSTRTITVNSGSLAFGINNIFGGGATAANILPSIVINQGSILTTNNYNLLGHVTLNGGTVTDTRTGAPGTYQAFEFKGPVTVNGSAPSLIQSANGFGHHLAGNITFEVADAAAGTDLTVSAKLLDASPDNPATPGSLTKTGGGTLALQAANVYTGATTIEEGTLTGSGSVTGPLTVNAGGTLAPGTGAGIFSAGPTTLAGTYACDIAGANADTLAVTGDLVLTGSTLRITALTPPTQPLYVIATFTGALTGTFASVTGLPVGFSVTYNEAAGQIELANSGVVPPYDTWEATHGISGAGATTDSDGDGILNGIEFILGGDPSGPDSDSNSLLPTTTADANYLNFAFRRTNASAAYVPVVEYGSALSGWTTAQAGLPTASPVLIVEEPNFHGAGIDRVTVRIPKALAATSKLFARLRVKIP